MSKHTEGEWVFQPDSAYVKAHISVDRRPIAIFETLSNPVDGIRMAAAPDMYTALENLVSAVARARKADDDVMRAGMDADEALLDEQQDAHATLIIRENEARAALARAKAK